MVAFMGGTPPFGILIRIGEGYGWLAGVVIIGMSCEEYDDVFTLPNASVVNLSRADIR